MKISVFEPSRQSSQYASQLGTQRLENWCSNWTAKTTVWKPISTPVTALENFMRGMRLLSVISPRDKRYRNERL